MPQKSNINPVRNHGSDRAVVFVHGFSGAMDDTWGKFPALVGSETAGWDIYTLGYATTLLPDVLGIWSADPDLPIVAMMLGTELRLPPFSKYKSLSLIAHSMGGLVVQKALVDHPELAAKVEHVILFGTPSGGLEKASRFAFWKRQLKNMAAGSSFLDELRKRWTNLYGMQRPFRFMAVAGASDQFVPPESSLHPFDGGMREVVPGNHVEIVKPDAANAPSVVLVVTTLMTGTPPAHDAKAAIRRAAAQETDDTEALVGAVESAPDTIWKDIVEAALALDRAGKRNESIALLERHKERDTDIKGALGGRYKRMWYDSGDRKHAERALELYSQGLAAADRPDQIYYHAINVAFMNLVFLDDLPAAREKAALALKHADPPDDLWKTATVAEAHLYFGRTADALAEYRRLFTFEAEEWKHQSASLQAGRIAAHLEDRDLMESLEAIFTPAARQVNRIFVSYSHKDKGWLERLRVMVQPYLRAAETELDFWDDTRLQAGQQWDVEINEALNRAGVAIALVSADFLASTYIMEKELPVLLKAARDGGLTLLWVYVSSAGWTETPLRQFQATHDTKTPLDALPPPQQNEILKSVAEQMKAAALAATQRFTSQPR